MADFIGLKSIVTGDGVMLAAGNHLLLRVTDDSKRGLRFESFYSTEGDRMAKGKKSIRFFNIIEWNKKFIQAGECWRVEILSFNLGNKPSNGGRTMIFFQVRLIERIEAAIEESGRIEGEVFVQDIRSGSLVIGKKETPIVARARVVCRGKFKDQPSVMGYRLYFDAEGNILTNKFLGITSPEKYFGKKNIAELLAKLPEISRGARISAVA